MKPILKRDSNTITVSIFYENYCLEKYNMDPPYQRKSVWSDEKQSFLIDSILKNFPVPPIFLRQHIDPHSGRTKYDVIDGKQRLSSIIRFIENQIPIADEEVNDDFSDPEIAGKYFDELEGSSLSEYKSNFWRYVIPVEYVDTTSKALVDQIFDRLNRNGEPLTGQELRNAQHNQSHLLAEVRKLKSIPFWRERIKHLDQARMEDDEFISELLFVLIERGPQEAAPAILDGMYGQYADDYQQVDEAVIEFSQVTEVMEAFDLDYQVYRNKGISHLYSLWTFSWLCCERSVHVDSVKSRLQQFMEEVKMRTATTPEVIKYKNAMGSRTKSRSQRAARLRALADFCGVEYK